MYSFPPGKKGQSALGVVADGHDEIELLVDELVDLLGAVAADIDADLGHDQNAPRRTWPGSVPAENGLETVAVQGVDQPLGHLGAGRVVRADEQDAFLHRPSS